MAHASPVRPAPNESLYRLGYPGFSYGVIHTLRRIVNPDLKRG